ncbi:MAG: hypothetical protein JO066_03205 [Verrucomicrobia bacterium]|nr:hypothetical protein [Verrucomicrobiota bacterium]
MDEKTQPRLEYEAPGINLWVSCAAIGLVVPAIAIYVTMKRLKKFKRQNPFPPEPPRMTRRRARGIEGQNQPRIGNEAPETNLRLVTGTAIDFVVSTIAIYVTVSAFFNLFKRQYPPTSAPVRIVRRELAMDEQNQQQNGHETRDISLRVVTWSAIGLVVSAIAICLTVGGLFNLFKSQHPSASAPSRITAPGTLPSQPRLQINPAYDLQQLREMENARLSSYGWVEKSAGIVRIPIDRAITLVAQRGLPARGNNNEVGGKTPLQMRQEKAEVSHP